MVATNRELLRRTMHMISEPLLWLGLREYILEQQALKTLDVRCDVIRQLTHCTDLHERSMRIQDGRWQLWRA